MRTIGVILAGGRARRLGGADKALTTLAGETLLSRCIARLTPQCVSLLLSANGDAARYVGFSIPVVSDDGTTREGPLAGLLATLDHAARETNAAFVVSVPVDTPFLPDDLVARLHEARQSAGADIAVAASVGRMHHAIALWPIAIRDDLRAAFVAGERSVGRFAARHRTTQVEWPAEPVDPFFNINTPDDLATAKAIIALRGGSGR